MKQAEKLEGASLDAPKIFGGARAMPSRETIRYSPSHQSLIATRCLPFTIRYSLPFYQSPFTICHSLFLSFRLAHLPTCRFADEFQLGRSLALPLFPRLSSHAPRPALSWRSVSASSTTG
jgi:hypothetical protein